jgi:hypothetical protein
MVVGLVRDNLAREALKPRVTYLVHGGGELQLFMARRS